MQLMDVVPYLLIFLARIVEVSLMTLRMVLITRGEKMIGAIIGFFQVIIWVLVANQVLTNITSDPFKVVAYAAGFAAGNYLGSILEGKLALGLSKIEIICMKDEAASVVENLRESGYGVTAMDAKGKTKERQLLTVHVRRKKVKEVLALVRNKDEDAMITVSESTVVYGGYGIAGR